MSSIIKSKKYGCVLCIGDTWHFLQPKWIDISFEEFEKPYEENGKELSEEFYIGIRALMPEEKKRKADGLIVDVYHSREEHTILYIVKSLAEANEIAAEIKENILAYIAAPAAATPLLDPPALNGKYIKEEEITPAISKLVFLTCEYVKWLGQNEEDEIVLSEIYGEVVGAGSRDCKGNMLDFTILTHNFSEPEETRNCIYYASGIQAAMQLHNSLLKKLRSEVITNITKRLQTA